MKKKVLAAFLAAMSCSFSGMSFTGIAENQTSESDSDLISAVGIISEYTGTIPAEILNDTTNTTAASNDSTALKDTDTKSHDDVRKYDSLTITVYNEDEGGYFTYKLDITVCGSPDINMGPGIGGTIMLCGFDTVESNPFVMKDIEIHKDYRYNVIDCRANYFDDYTYVMDYDRFDKELVFSDAADQKYDIYMKKNYYTINSEKNISYDKYGKEFVDYVLSLDKSINEIINSNEFKALDTSERIESAEELMKSLADEKKIADYSFNETEHVMEFTYNNSNITGKLPSAVFDDEHKQLKQNDTTEAEEEISYKIVRLPDKVEYRIGEQISLKGIQIEVTKGNEEPVVYTYPDVAFAYQSNIPKPATVLLYSDFRSNKAGTYKVKVVGEDSVSFDVKVVDDNADDETQEYSFEDIRSMTTEEIKALFESKDMTKEKGYTVWTKESILNMRNTMIGGVDVNILPDPDKHSSFNDKYMFSSDLFWEREKLEKALGLPQDLFGVEQFMMGLSDESLSIECHISPKAYDEEEKAELQAAAFNYIQFSPYFVGFMYHMLGGTVSEHDVSEIVETVKGDANCNGKVEISDAVLIMQSISNPSKYSLTEQGRKNADLAGDNDGITNADALEIQKKLLGLISNDTDNSAIAGKIFVYEKEGTGSEFTITFNPDGTFEYYTGVFSSYIGAGKWEIKGDTVVMTESTSDKVNRLRIQDSDLIYIADGSDNFYGVRVNDGEKFYRQSSTS